MRFVMDGEMPEYLLAKDLILQVGVGVLQASFWGKGGGGDSRQVTFVATFVETVVESTSLR